MATATLSATLVASLILNSHSKITTASSSVQKPKISVFAKPESICFRYSGPRICRVLNANKLVRTEMKSRATGIIRANAAQVAKEACPSAQKEMEIVDVDLGDQSYPIYSGSGLLDRLDLLQSHVKGQRVLVVTNTTVHCILSRGCGPDCTDDGMHYKGVVYEAVVQIILNALLVESQQINF